MNIAASLPDDVKAYLVAAGEKFQPPLSALCAAESLTDEVAIQLSTVAGLEEKEAIRFVRALHHADFVIERNSEWHFNSQMRTYLSANLVNQPTLFSAAHSLLFEISVTGDPKCAGESIPRYLLSGVGKAFHKSASSAVDGLKLYMEAASRELDGTQWLLGRLAIEQQEQGILPKGAVEPPFLRGMTLYQERRLNEAEYFLRRVIKSEEIREEVAISCHLIGKMDSRKPGMHAAAEELLRRSIEIGEKIHHEHHLAQALHTLGQLVGKDRSRVKEAEELLRRSLALLVKLHDQHGQAQALHTLGQLVGKDRSRVKEAEELLRRCLALDKTQHGQAQALHTLGQLVGKDRSRVKEAEELLRRSIEIGEKIHHEHHLAQALHTLGQLVGKDRSRVKEAEELLRRSLALLVKLHDQHGQAQALHTLGQLVGKDRSRVKEAEELLRRSLEISKRNKNHQAQVLFTLGKLIWDIVRPEAEQMLRRSIDINQTLKNNRMQKMVQEELDRRLDKH